MSTILTTQIETHSGTLLTLHTTGGFLIGSFFIAMLHWKIHVLDVVVPKKFTLPIFLPPLLA
jgi:hypothetical protein